ncbi:pilus assembly protein PilZ [Lentibacillus lipolyticus]|nr:pilus assembly protein PilZ [Lentibacillus lipolyticus]
MKIGMALNLEVNDRNSGEMITCRSKVIEQNEYYLFIDLPIDTRTDKTVFFPSGTHVMASYIGENQALCTFETHTTETVKLNNIPALAMHLPNPEQIKTIQRRRFVRIKTAADIAVHGKIDAFTTVTMDISGGGLSVVLPAGSCLAEKERVSIWLVLQMQKGNYHYIAATAQVTRISQDRNGKGASLEFLVISEQEQQHIIRYCFEKQRESRKKELR